MRLELNYIMKDGPLVDGIGANLESPMWVRWMHNMVEWNKDTNFFFTISTTDIFPPDPQDGVENIRLHSISLDAEPGPSGGHILCVQKEGEEHDHTLCCGYHG